MIEFKRCFDLFASINKFVSSRRPQGAGDFIPVQPRILTQEKNGIIIYAWNELSSPGGKSNILVTHIGLFDPETQGHKVIWINNQKIKIASCSINQERTLLAFATVTRQETSTDGKPRKDIYRAFLTELQTTGTRVFSLNLEKTHFLKVQFLYRSHDEVSARESHLLVFLHKESIGLYHIPLARLGDRGVIMSGQPKTVQIIRKFVWCQWDAQHQRLHYIHNCHHGSDGSGGSQTVFQKLSTIQFYCDGKYDNMLDLPLNFPFPYIRSSSRSHYTYSPLNPGIPDISLNACVLTQPSGTYCFCYHQVTSGTKVVGSPVQSPTDDEYYINYYICMVHHVKTLHGCVSGLPKGVLAFRRLSFHWIGDYVMVLLPGYFVHLLNVGIEYEPCHHILLHNQDRPRESTVSLKPHGTDFATSASAVSVASNISDKEEENDTAKTVVKTSGQSVRFQAVGDTKIPPEIFGDQPIPDVLSVISNACQRIHSLSPCVSFSREPGNTGGCVYDYQNGQIWKMSVSLDGLTDYFKMAYWPTRLAIIHYLLLRTKDFVSVKKVFFEVCQDVTSPEVSVCLAEFLIATTYSSMKRQLERDVFRLLPFTASDTLRGQFERNKSGDRLARLSYLSVNSININTKTAKERQRRHKEDLWDTLRRHLRQKQLDQPGRFSQERVHKAFSRMVDDWRHKKKLESTMKEKSFLGSVLGQRNGSSTPVPSGDPPSGRRSRTDTALGTAPHFLQGTAREQNFSSNKLGNMTEELLTVHLTKHLKKDSRVKAQNVAKEYVTCQAQQSKQLCHLLWSLRGPVFSESDDNYLPSLSEVGCDEEYELFQLFERLYLTSLEKAYPLTPGFPTYFTVLGFRCLHPRLFLQYVDRGVLELTGEFITQLLADLQDDDDDDDEENVTIKYQIISRLPKHQAEECFRQWNHPICARYFAQCQVAKVLLEGQNYLPKKKTEAAVSNLALREKASSSSMVHVADSMSTASGSSVDYMAFQPLSAFITHLETTMEAAHDQHKKPRPGPGINISAVDHVLLEDVGLHYTRHTSCYNMSTVSF